MEEETAAAAVAGDDDDDGAADDDDDDDDDGAPMGRRWREPLEGGEDIVSWLWFTSLRCAWRGVGGGTYGKPAGDRMVCG
jgi:hypothetical protein